MGKKRRLLAAGAAVLVAALVWAFSRRPPEPVYLTASAERGDVIDAVGATGTLEAMTTVQVGSQVSGTILSLQADFNSQVRNGQLIARLDPSLFEARLGQARANLVAARANVERQRAADDDARRKLARAQELSGQQLLPASDLETAQANAEASRAQLKALEAAVSQAEANVLQAEVDLTHTMIRAPIDGVVIARNVDVGQTVAASFQAPVLFVIANDLTRMRVNASIDEADIGRVEPGQPVLFRVDAHPEREFRGTLQQVRLQPVTAQNVVTYHALISVDNAEQRLMPGMTATVTVIVRRRDDVLRIPQAALRYRPEGAEGTGPGGGRPSTAGGGQAAAAPAGRREGRSGNGPGGADGPRASGRPAVVYVLGADGRPQAAPVRLGLSDGQYVEVVEGLGQGAQVVTGELLPVAAPGARPSASPSSSNPFAPQRERRTR
jgi:HlyD family secretion protein